MQSEIEPGEFTQRIVGRLGDQDDGLVALRVHDLDRAPSMTLSRSRGGVAIDLGMPM